MSAKTVRNARIGACAVIFRAEHGAKVAQIAEARNVSEDEAARMYVVGALKASVRRGTANTYEEALDRFEADQVGDRSTEPKREAPILREVRRINAENDIGRGSGIPHRRNMGKVLGTLYVEWEGAESASAPDVIMEREDMNAYKLHIESSIQRYLDEYVTRLSRSARATIHSLVHDPHGIDGIMAAKDSEASKLRERAKNIHRNFPHKDAVTTREMLELFAAYVA